MGWNSRDTLNYFLDCFGVTKQKNKKDKNDQFIPGNITERYSNQSYLEIFVVECRDIYMLKHKKYEGIINGRINEICALDICKILEEPNHYEIIPIDENMIRIKWMNGFILRDSWLITLALNKKEHPILNRIALTLSSDLSLHEKKRSILSSNVLRFFYELGRMTVLPNGDHEPGNLFWNVDNNSLGWIDYEYGIGDHPIDVYSIIEYEPFYFDLARKITKEELKNCFCRGFEYQKNKVLKSRALIEIALCKNAGELMAFQSICSKLEKLENPLSLLDEFISQI